MLNMTMKKMCTHLLGEEEVVVVEVVEGGLEGVEVHVGMDTWNLLMVDGRMTMLLCIQAMVMVTMLLLMPEMGMPVVEAVASGAMAGEVVMVASLIISKMEGIMMRHLLLHHSEVGVVVSGAVAEEVADRKSVV